MRELLPNTKILLISVLPRTGTDYFDRIVGINARIRVLHDGENVFYLDMFNQFRGDDAWGGEYLELSQLNFFFNFIFPVVPSTLFSDGIHLTTAGYELWAEIMNPVLNQLIQE